MYPISDAVKALFDGENRHVLRITGVDKNGNRIALTNANIMQGGFNIDRYACNGERLEIGTAVSSELTLKIDNRYGAFNDIVFENTELFVEIGVADWTQRDPVVYYVPCGYFTSDEQPRATSVITVNALDRMMRFDKEVSGSSDCGYLSDSSGNNIVDESENKIVACPPLASFPCTVSSLVSQCCDLFGIELGNSISGMPNASLVINSIPASEQTVTYRNLIQWCAALLGANAYIDWEGKLRFEFFTNTTGYVTSTANRFDSTMFENDVTISGVEYTDSDNELHLVGSDNYTFDLTGNLLITEDNVNTVLYNLYNVLHAFTYRPFTASVVSAPYLWPMDRVVFKDKNNVSHVSSLTNVNITINGATQIAGTGETDKVNSYAKPGAFTGRQALALQQISTEVNNNLNEAVENATNMITGADGGYVRFMYDSNDQLNEILIMDEPSVDEAVNVWRWNVNGLGFSSSGVNGTYATAITNNGAIVANFITTGELDANIIKTGILDGDLVSAKKLSILDGNNNVVATFDASVTIGDTNSTHATITNNSFSLYVDSTSKAFSVSLENGDDGIARVVQEFTADGYTSTFDLRYIVPDGEVEYGDVTYVDVPLAYVYVNGTLLAPLNGYTTADVVATGGSYSYTQIVFTAAPAANTTIRIEYDTKTPIIQLLVGTKLPSSNPGRFSVVLGCDGEASGDYSISEGLQTVASGFGSHAEGAPYYNDITSDYTDSPVASGNYSHAEGCGTVASGEYSHAEGFCTQSAHIYSHAQGEGTITGNDCQFVFGMYNVVRSSHAEVVGWGTSDSNREDIRRLARNGNMWIKGSLTQNSDARLKTECGTVPDVSSIPARVFRWNDKAGVHDDLTHIGYYAQDVESVAPYLVSNDEITGRKSLDYIGFLCAKVECLERRVTELESRLANIGGGA